MPTETFNDVVAKLSGWIDAAILMLPNLGAALLVMGVFWFAARLAARLVAGVLRRTTPFDEINRLVTRVVWIAVLAAGFFIALGILQLDKTVTSLVAGAGIVTPRRRPRLPGSGVQLRRGLLLQLRHPFRRGHLVRPTTSTASSSTSTCDRPSCAR